MMRALRAVLAALVLATPLAAQQGWSETRFHRVHLRNGNFIDGQMIKETGREVTLQLKVGTVSVRLDQIARTEDGRLRVELVKMKSYNEKPPVIPLKGPQPGPTPETPRKPDLPFPPTGARTPPAAAPFEPKGDTRQKVDQILQQIGKTASDQKYQTAELLAQAGEGWAPYVVSLAEGLEQATRSLALAMVEKSRDPAALPIARKLLGSAKADVRADALRLLTGYEDRASAGEVRALLRDPDPIVRGAAISSLESLADADSFDAIGRLAMDKEGAVRQRAFNALRNLAQKHGLQDGLASIAAEALDSLQGDARAEALDALARLGRPAAWNRIAALLSDDSPSLKISALQALARLNAPESADAILERLPAERNPDVQAQMATALRMMKCTKAIGPLVELASSSQDLTVTGACTRALRELTGLNVGNAAKWKEWWDRNKPK